MSDLRFTCDISAVSGERITHIWIGGEGLDLSDEMRYLKLVAMEEMLSGAFGFPVICYEPTGLILGDALENNWQMSRWTRLRWTGFLLRGGG